MSSIFSVTLTYTYSLVLISLVALRKACQEQPTSRLFALMHSYHSHLSHSAPMSFVLPVKVFPSRPRPTTVLTKPVPSSPSHPTHLCVSLYQNPSSCTFVTHIPSSLSVYYSTSLESNHCLESSTQKLSPLCTPTSQSGRTHPSSSSVRDTLCHHLISVLRS
jgi:hypothetical protein